MSHITAIAHRIKVITNIQKTAHAMQLIAMSTLSRINHRKKSLEQYTNELKTLTEELVPAMDSTSLTTSGGTQYIPKKLFLIIGSQKGFCGNFNNTLFYATRELLKQEDMPISAIALGPYAYEFCKKNNIALVSEQINFALNTITEKTDTIFDKILELGKNTGAGHFDTLVIVSNSNTSIFLQKTKITTLNLYTKVAQTMPIINYALEQNYAEIAHFVYNVTLRTELLQLLLESLRAENSARALAMDSSTRNADKLLDEMKLVYNKLRQAKVTKELTELSSSI